MMGFVGQFLLFDGLKVLKFVSCDRKWHCQ